MTKVPETITEHYNAAQDLIDQMQWHLRLETDGPRFTTFDHGLYSFRVPPRVVFQQPFGQLERFLKPDTTGTKRSDASSEQGS